MSVQVLGWLVAGILACGISSDSAWAADQNVSRTLSMFLDSMDTESGDRLRDILYDIDKELSQGRLSIDSRTAADSLVEALLDVAQREPPGHTRWKAFELLSKNPHPATANFMVETLELEEGRSWQVHGEALKMLVALRDSRAYLFLREILLSPATHAHSGAIDMIASLNDPRGIQDLKTVIADQNLPHRFEAARDPKIVAERERGLAERALVRLRLGLEEDVICMFDLDESARLRLAAQGFVMTPETENEMFEFYGDEYPFVTSDVLLHTFMILYRAFLDELESMVLVPRLQEFSLALMHTSLEAAGREGAGQIRDALYGAAAYGTVLSRVSGTINTSPAALPEPWKTQVEEEVARVESASGTHMSPLLGYEDNYRKYRPSGRHEDAQQLEGYYRASQFARRMRFRLQNEESSLIGLAVAGTVTQNAELWEQWLAWERLNDDLFGPVDDVTLRSAREALAGESWPGMLGDPAARDRVLGQLRRLPGPRINTMVFTPSEYTNWPKLAQSLALLAPSYDPSTHLLQAWMDQGEGSPCWPPTGLLVAAGLLGSAQAGELLKEMGVRCPAPGIPIPGDPSLASLFLGQLRELFSVPRGAPRFMASEAWEEKQVNTALGAWTELRHATALYTKDANSYLGMSAMLDRFHGYVEPYPELYRMIAGSVQKLQQVAMRESLFDRIEADRVQRATHGDSLRRGSQQDFQRHVDATMRLSKADLRQYSDMVLRLVDLSERLLAGEPQTISDGIFLKNLGRQLAHLSFHRSGLLHAQYPMSLVTDVATAWVVPREAFQIAVGKPLAIYVAVPFEGKTFVCRGSVYSYYEWTRPIEDRWDDRRWKQTSSVPHMSLRPWVASRPQLGLHRDLTRKDIGLLMKQQDNWGNFGGGNWRPSQDEDAARPFTYADIKEDLLPELFRLAHQDTLNRGVRAFALASIGHFAERPDVETFFREEIASACSQAQKNWSGADQTRAVYSMMGMRHILAEDPEVLAAIKLCLDQHRAPWFRKEVLEVLGLD